MSLENPASDAMLAHAYGTAPEVTPDSTVSELAWATWADVAKLTNAVADLRNEVAQIARWQGEANEMLAGMREQAEGLLSSPMVSQLTSMFGG